MQKRTLAQRRHDFAEVEAIEAQLAELAATLPPDRPGNVRDDDDILAKVNERNRRANMEAVRKAEIAEADRKRRERKLAAAAGSTSTPVDPSARLRTVPRLFNSATPSTRPGTPNLNGASTPQAKSVATLPYSSFPTALNEKAKTLQSSLIDSIEVDLGDF